ncbi:DUF2141 domain-containing protein [Mesorhizobium sp. KR1-2]|uniref:DUF2141 domain-containing protein n=1 Tax=Mesorhizobium sp. KR1-2 TaxID=3156609 RepID=UPI0032B5B24B
MFGKKGAWLALMAGGLVLVPVGAQAESLNVTVTRVRSSEGVVRCGLFASADGFRTPGREAHAADAAIKDGQAVCRFTNVAPGAYALAVFHAEKNEAAIQYGVFGKPKQGVGFSNNPSITFGAPSFDKARFAVNKPRVDLSIALQY